MTTIIKCPLVPGDWFGNGLVNQIGRHFWQRYSSQILLSHEAWD